MTSPRSSSGVFKKVCFICEKENRKHKGERLPLLLSTKELEKSIKNIVLTLNDQNLITKLEVDKKNGTICDFVAKEVMYHSMCRVELQRRAEQKSFHWEKRSGMKSGKFIQKHMKL